MVAVRNSIPSPTTDPEELARRDVSRFRLAQDQRTTPGTDPIFQDPTLQGADPELGFDEESRRTNTIASFRRQAQEQVDASLDTAFQQPLQEVTPGQTSNQLESRQVSITRPTQQAPTPPTPDQEAAETARLEARAQRNEATGEALLEKYIERGLIKDPRIEQEIRGLVADGPVEGYTAERAAKQNRILARELRSKGAGRAARLAASGAMTREDRFEALKPGSRAGADLDSVSRVAQALEDPNAEVSDVDLVRFGKATESKTAVINDSRRETENLRGQVTERRSRGIQEGRASIADSVAGLNLENTSPAEYDAIIKESVAGLPSIERSAALADARARLPEPIQAQLKIDRNVELAGGKADALGTIRSKELNDLNFAQNFSTVKSRLNPDSPAAQVSTYEELAENPEALALFNTYLKDEATLVNGKVVDRTPKKGKGATAGGREFTEAEISTLESGSQEDATIIKQASGVQDFVAGEGDMIVYKGTQPLENRIASTARRLVGEGAELSAALKSAALELIGSEDSLKDNTAAEILGFKGNAARDLLIEGATLRTDELGQANRIKADEFLGDSFGTVADMGGLVADVGAEVFESELAGGEGFNSETALRGAVEERINSALAGAELGLGTDATMDAVVARGMASANADLQGLRDKAAADNAAQTKDAVGFQNYLRTKAIPETQEYSDGVFDSMMATGVKATSVEEGRFAKVAETTAAGSSPYVQETVAAALELSKDENGVISNPQLALEQAGIRNVQPVDANGVSPDVANTLKTMGSETPSTVAGANDTVLPSARWAAINGRRQDFEKAMFTVGGELQDTAVNNFRIASRAWLTPISTIDKETGQRTDRFLTVEEFQDTGKIRTVVGLDDEKVKLATAFGKVMEIGKEDPTVQKLMQSRNPEDRSRGMMLAYKLVDEQLDSRANNSMLASAGTLGTDNIQTAGRSSSEILNSAMDEALNIADPDDLAGANDADLAAASFRRGAALKRELDSSMGVSTAQIDVVQAKLDSVVAAYGGTPPLPTTLAEVSTESVSAAEALWQSPDAAGRTPEQYAREGLRQQVLKREVLAMMQAADGASPLSQLARAAQRAVFLTGNSVLTGFGTIRGAETTFADSAVDVLLEANEDADRDSLEAFLSGEIAEELTARKEKFLVSKGGRIDTAPSVALNEGTKFGRFLQNGDQ